MSNLFAAANALRNKANQTPSPSNTAQPSYSPNLGYSNSGKNPLMQEFQTAIKLKRKAQGLTQRALAKKINLSQGTITRAERHGWVSIWTMLRIIDGLGGKITIT